MKITKKLTAFLLTFALIIGIIPLSFLTASAETVKMGYIFETNVNIREDATTLSDKVATVSKWNVKVTGSKKDTNNAVNPATDKTYVWYKISYTSQSQTVTGYVREDLITVTQYTLDPDFKATLSAFPESYHNDLILLHAMYPKWTFTADNVGTSFTSSVIAQDKDYIKVVETGYTSWRSMRNKCYNWETNSFITTDGGRYGASREVIAYYMDPRNFLNANDIYIYMQQSYDNKTQTLAGVQSLLDGTFLEGNVTDKNDKYPGKPYAGVIRYAASQSGVNAYVLASTIIQEQGVKGSTLGKGTTYKGKTVYNFFNYGASGTTESDILTNGKKYAYNAKWFTPTEAILGGAQKYGSGYIDIGQDTYFYKNYNVLNPDKIWHQYAQNVADSLSSSRGLKNTYTALHNMALTFRIPVYTSLPSKVSKLPAKSDKLNNYYFEDLNVDGISPAFNRHTSSYTLTVKGDTEIYYKLPSGASYTGETTYSLKKGENTVKLKVKSQTGYSRTYTVKVTAEKDAVLSLKNTGGTLVKEADGKWYYYIDGVKTDDTTLVKYSGKWFYVKNGVWDKTANTLVKYAGKWFYVEDGKWSSKTDLVKYSGKWFYVKGGKWDSSVSTLFKKNGKWFAIKSGKWYKEKAIIPYKTKKFYAKGGFAQLGFSGKVTINSKTYSVKKGKVI